MKFAIIISKKDEAGMNIFNHLNKKLKHLCQLVEQDIIYAEIDNLEDYDFIIFASKHSGKNTHTLSLHAPGNWKKAEMGGQENKVCKTSAIILKHFFQILNKNKQDWDITLEVTHHGPYIEKPCLFIEIGGQEEDWIKEDAGQIIARTIQEAIEDINKGKVSQENRRLSGIGIGGPHYCPNFNKIQLNSEYATGHIIPQYVFPITKEILQEAIKKTTEPVSLAIIDWKGLKGEQRQQVIKLCTELRLEVKKTSEINK